MSDPKHVGKVVRCEGCGADIRFVLLDSGAKHPVEAKGRTLVLIDGDQRGRVVRLFESHFAGCPQADMFRKRS